ncbi:arginase family protein [Salinibacterium soli]|uniref:Arginase family protein n=1 Tax=Antiquaquibacter soli TaxID=3064523 RepID=A0ABT9BM07_9MICO|nr:arginase family protein [Protaetiibacter sp. WY-16]MDO7881483.1 arginase family protein [Protaetiibacter sp. WY-16]
MAVTFVVAPEWQGSGSPRAMRLVDGAEAIRGDLPSAATRVVDIPLEAGDAQGTGVHRLSSIAVVRDRVAETLAGVTGPAITIGGDCGVELGAIEHASAPGVAVVWFDAHPDLNSPESSPSGAFGGMVLRTLLGDGPSALVPAVPLDPTRVVIAGARAIDDGEEEYLAATGIPMLSPDDVSAESIVAAVEATGATAVYIHVDLDVLDPAEIEGLAAPLPFGLGAAQLVEAVRALRERFEFAGAGITAFAPASMAAAVDDMPTILRLIGALAR